MPEPLTCSTKPFIALHPASSTVSNRMDMIFNFRALLFGKDFAGRGTMKAK
jgi:hypothetical protein